MCKRVAIVVAADRVNGRDRSERVDHLAAPDVPGVKDPVHAAQRSDRLRTKKTVGVQDQPDAHAA